MQIYEVCLPKFYTTSTVSMVRVPAKDVKFIMSGTSETAKYHSRSIGIVTYEFFDSGFTWLVSPNIQKDFLYCHQC